MKNKFDEHFEQVHNERKEKAALSRSANRYAPRPYHERNRPLYLFALGVSFACHAITVSASASNVFQFLHNFLSGLFAGAAIAAIICVAFLASIEWLKRWMVGGFWKDFHDPHNYAGERIYQGGRLIFITAIFVMDMALAYNGSWEFVKVVKDAPTLQAPTLVDVDAINARYEPQIAEANKAATDFYNSRSYLGKLSIADGNKYRALRKDATNLTEARDAALLKADTDNRASQAKAQADYEAKLFDFNNQVQNQGHWLAWVSIASFLVLGLALYYAELYQYRLWFYNREQKHLLDAKQRSLNGHNKLNGNLQALGNS